MTNLMKRDEYAAHRKVHPTSVSKWNKAGLLVFGEDPNRPGKMLIDVEKTDASLRAKVDTTTGRPRKDDGPVLEYADPAPAPAKNSQPLYKPQLSEMEQARLDNIREKNIRAQIDRATLMGQLVPIAEFTSRASEMGRMVRERSMALIRQHSERIAAETDARKVVSILSDAFDEMFSAIADEIEHSADEEMKADAVLATVEAETGDLGEGEDDMEVENSP